MVTDSGTSVNEILANGLTYACFKGETEKSVQSKGFLQSSHGKSQAKQRTEETTYYRH